MTSHIIGYKNFNTHGNFTHLLRPMDNLITRYENTLFPHIRNNVGTSSVASNCNQCARYRNTKNDHDIGTQTHIQDFELTSHSPNALFVAFESTNLCANI